MVRLWLAAAVRWDMWQLFVGPCSSQGAACRPLGHQGCIHKAKEHKSQIDCLTCAQNLQVLAPGARDGQHRN